MLFGKQLAEKAEHWASAFREEQRKKERLQKRLDEIVPELDAHRYKAGRNDFIRFLLKGPSPTEIENRLSHTVAQPYHLSLRCLTKAQLKKQLEVY